MGLLEHGMASLCLFDIYRGVFTDESKRIKSSSATSEVQAATKLSLLIYLLNFINKDQLGPNDQNLTLKSFLGDLVIGIHQEMVNDNHLTSADYKNAPKGIDQYMGAQEYQKMLHACVILDQMVDKD